MLILFVDFIRLLLLFYNAKFQFHVESVSTRFGLFRILGLQFAQLLFKHYFVLLIFFILFNYFGASFHFLHNFFIPLGNCISFFSQFSLDEVS